MITGSCIAQGGAFGATTTLSTCLRIQSLGLGTHFAMAPYLHGGQGKGISFPLEFIAKGNRFKFDPDSGMKPAGKSLRSRTSCGLIAAKLSHVTPSGSFNLTPP